MRNRLLLTALLLGAGDVLAADQLNVSLSSNVGGAEVKTGDPVVFEVTTHGGTPPYVYAWDLDGDRVVDRRSASPRIEVSFPSAGEWPVAVDVTDAASTPALGSDSLAQSVRGMQLVVEAVGAPTQRPNSSPGNNDNQLDPGEIWQQVVRFRNAGQDALPAGHALIAESKPAGTPLVERLHSTLTPITLPLLASGESFTQTVLFSVPRDAQCGMRIAYDFVLGINAQNAEFTTQPLIDRTVAAVCTPLGSGPSITPPPGTPPQGFRPGLYFNPARPGNGLATFVYGTPTYGLTRFGGAWFSALPDRTPVWYTLQGELLNHRGTLPILQFRNTAAPDGFQPVAEEVGSAWIWQIDGARIVLAWSFDDGRFGAEIMQPNERALGHPNHTQTWFDRHEPGWGMAIESPALLSAMHPNGRPFEFFGAFVYDAQGAPRWATGAIDSRAGGTVDLIAHRPHCPGCPFISDWTVENAAAGSLQMDYDAPSNLTLGTLSTAIELPPVYGGGWLRPPTRIHPIAIPQATPVP